MAPKNKKNRVDIIYSTNDDYQFDYEDDNEQTTLPPNEQTLKVSLDKKARKGKTVTLIDGFVGTEEDLKSLGKMLKSKCGVGGSVKDEQIFIQGEAREKVIALLKDQNYKVKRVGG
jgi:translation initiation factor 1